MNVSAACLALCVLVAACSQSHGGSTAQVPAKALPDEGKIASIPLGDLAGVAQSNVPGQIRNPFDGNPEAVAQGKELFGKMNCAGCHGYTVEGAMGPDLKDQYWRYGGTPVEIFKSIYEGRPQGMPAWGQALPAAEIWKITAYLQSLGGSFPDNSFHAERQGDRPGEVVAPEVNAPPMQPNQMKALAPRGESPASGGGNAQSQQQSGTTGSQNQTSNGKSGSVEQNQAMPPR